MYGETTIVTATAGAAMITTGITGVTIGRTMMAATEIVATIVAMTAAMEGGIVAGEEVGKDE